MRAKGKAVREKADVAKLVQEMNRSRLQDQDNPFRNVLLVVHCRLRGPDKEDSICAKREHLFEGYKKFFPDVLYLTQENCPRRPGNPHRCLSELMTGRALPRDGIFYMHFDALIRPSVLGRDFNTSSIGIFDEYRTCGINKTSGDQIDCNWTVWTVRRAEALRGAIYTLREGGPPEFRDLDDTHFYLGNDDMFYLPRSVFPLYIPLAQRFEDFNVHHEYGGPTIRHLLHNLTSVPIDNMRCSGNCCSDLDQYDALSPDFRCGHAFDLNSTAIQDVFPSAILLRQTSPGNVTQLLDSMRRVRA